MTDQTIGFAIIGPGIIAHVHAKAIVDTPGIKLVAVYGRSAEKTAAFAADYGIRAITDLAALLADPAVTVVVICSPSGTHAELAIAAAKAGKHVLCEKPLDTTLAKTDRMIKACAARKVVLYPCFQYRCGDAARQLKAAVDAGRIGRPVLGRATVKWHRPQEYYASAAWRGTVALDGGGALINQSIHAIDLLLHCLGDPVEIIGRIATLTHPGIEVEDTACAVLRFASGALATIDATTSTEPELAAMIEITGDAGSIGLEGERLARWTFKQDRPEDAEIRRRAAETPIGNNDKAVIHRKHCRQLADLIGVLRDGKKPLVTPQDGRRALAVILAIYESSRTGKMVRLRRPTTPRTRGVAR